MRQQTVSYTMSVTLSGTRRATAMYEIEIHDCYAVVITTIRLRFDGRSTAYQRSQ